MYQANAIADRREELVVVNEQIAPSIGSTEEIGELEVHGSF